MAKTEAQRRAEYITQLALPGMAAQWRPMFPVLVKSGYDRVISIEIGAEN